MSSRGSISRLASCSSISRVSLLSYFRVASFFSRTLNDFKTNHSAKKEKSVRGRSATQSGVAPPLGPTQTQDPGRAPAAAAEATARALDHIPETGRMTRGTASTIVTRRPKSGTAVALPTPLLLLWRSTRRFVQWVVHCSDFFYFYFFDCLTSADPQRSSRGHRTAVQWGYICSTATQFFFVYLPCLYYPSGELCSHRKDEVVPYGWLRFFLGGIYGDTIFYRVRNEGLVVVAGGSTRGPAVKPPCETKSIANLELKGIYICDLSKE